MKNLRLSVKLIGGFIIVALITLIVGFIGYRGIAQTDDALKEVTENHLKAVLALAKLNEAEMLISSSEHILLYEKNPGIVQKQFAQIEEGWKLAETGRKLFEPLHKTKEEETLWKEFGTKWEEWKTKHKEVLELVKKGDHKGAFSLSFGKAEEAFLKSEKLLHELTEHTVKDAEEFEKRAHADAYKAEYMSLAGMIIGTIVALLLGFFLSRSITKPINKVVAGLTDGSEQVASASTQVSSASQSLAEGASEQAAGIEETSSSIEEMSSMTKQNADNANQANTLMADTSRVVEEANRSMSELTGSMKEISTASEETAKIIKTIDEIAFQTNLLALNAAVEAARAGEAGAGFAVVADEVRNLAMRAADAAKNTANLIEGTVKKIKNGSEIVSKTNEAFGKVATGAKKVGELVGEISAASNEQAQGIDQINKAVAEMDKVVQKNAASAEESASAAEEMNAQAEQMKAFVGELAAVVGGSRNGNGVVYERASTHKSGNGGHIPALSHHPKVEVKKVQASLVKKGKELKGLIPRTKEVRPEQVIPMGEGDFKEF
ncbi:MAG: methyl-accepting chemotaxis protein [Thermodesulfobacteriota bacterium]|nr:methyl-accepting chemotaxis protein [Thermodesulfobacteriota bacterium]